MAQEAAAGWPMRRLREACRTRPRHDLRRGYPQRVDGKVLTEAWKRESAAEAANPTHNKVARKSYVMLAAFATEGTTLGDSLNSEDRLVIAGRMFHELGARLTVMHPACADTLGERLL